MFVVNFQIFVKCVYILCYFNFEKTREQMSSGVKRDFRNQGVYHVKRDFLKFKSLSLADQNAIASLALHPVHRIN